MITLTSTFAMRKIGFAYFSYKLRAFFLPPYGLINNSSFRGRFRPKTEKNECVMNNYDIQLTIYDLSEHVMPFFNDVLITIVHGDAVDAPRVCTFSCFRWLLSITALLHFRINNTLCIINVKTPIILGNFNGNIGCIYWRRCCCCCWSIWYRKYLLWRGQRCVWWVFSFWVANAYYIFNLNGHFTWRGLIVYFMSVCWVLGGHFLLKLIRIFLFNKNWVFHYF